MSRLYFDCPIQALYMMKEFGVEFECKNTDEEMIEHDLTEEGRFYPFLHCGIWQPDALEDIDWDNFRRIYVAKESEHIFKPKEGDFGLDIDNQEGAIFEKGDDFNWQYIGYKIIMRNNKPFFTALVEE